jgi:hypothetical protein
MEGYFFSFLVTHVINFGLSLRRLLKLTGKLMPLSVPLITLSATACGIFLAGALPTAPLKGVVFVLLLGCFLWLFGVVSREDLLWLKGLIKIRKT